MQSVTSLGFSPDLPMLLQRFSGKHLSTRHYQIKDRLEWLQHIIEREYTQVQIGVNQPSTLYNEMVIYPWSHEMRLSTIRSNGITIKQCGGVSDSEYENYFFVLLTAGDYTLKQNNRQITLHSGELTFYDATRPHQIYSANGFSKVLITIPKVILDQQITSLDAVVATSLASNHGIGLIARQLIQQTLLHQKQFHRTAFDEKADDVLQCLAYLLDQSKRQNLCVVTDKLLMLQIKSFIYRHLTDEKLSANSVAAAMGISRRYLNNLFHRQNNAPANYIIEQRLLLAKRLISNHRYAHLSITAISEIAGMKNLSHFSRIFKKEFGLTAKEYRYLCSQTRYKLRQ